jgi:hypothetical protein
VGYTYDSTVYLAGARSLAEQHSYRFVAHVGAPTIGFYPPLQSLYLSLAWMLNGQFPANIPWIIGSMVALSLVVSWLMYLYLAREGLPVCAALVCSLAFVSSPLWFGNLVHLYSETLFTALGLALALLWQTPSPLAGNRRWLMTGALFGLLYLTKTAAVGPIAGMLILLAWNSRARLTRAAACFVLPVLLAFLCWRAMRGASPGYAEALRLRWDQEGGWWPLFLFQCRSAWDYVSGQPFLDILFPAWLRAPHLQAVRRLGLASPISFAVLATTLGFMACAAVGWWRTRTPFASALALLILLYVAQLIVWPYHLGSRVLFVIMPFMIGWAWHGITNMPQRAGVQAWLRRVLACLLGGATALNLHMSARERPGHERLNSLPELIEVSAWIRDHVPADTSIAAGYSLPILHLRHYTGRALLEDYFTEPVGFVPIAFRSHRQRAGYLVAIRDAGTGAARSLPSHLEVLNRRYPGLFEIAAESSQGRYMVLRVNQPVQERYLKDYFP